MNLTKKFPLKFLYMIIIVSAIIVTFASVEVLIKAKNVDFYNSYIKILKEQGVLNDGLQKYLTYMTGMYFARIAVPVGLSLNALYAWKKDLLTKMFIVGWTIFLSGAMAFSLLTLETTSAFYYIFLILFIVLIIIVLSLNKEFSEKQKKSEELKNKKEKSGGVKK